ncbi:hypothetical protein [Kitasatospora aureofaciens]|uniref:hypothetical protein n=1 Tax=Kitasatospora aureofaciens TaxID=1894 RepID=UPI00131B0BB8|nr:hypothetical protein [Kitasatospora aureofaciens]
METLLTLGWFHWYRCVSRRTAEGPDYLGPDFQECLRYFRPLHGLCPERIPDQVVTVMSRQPPLEPAQAAEEGVRLGNLANAHLAAYNRTGRPEDMRQAIALLHQAVAAMAAAGLRAELWQYQLVQLLLRWHLRFGDSSSLDRAVAWADHTVDGLTEARDEQAVPLLSRLGDALFEAHQTRPERRLSQTAVRALHRVQEAAADSEDRQQARLRLIGLLIGEYLHSPQGELVEAAAANAEALVAECGPRGRSAIRLLQACEMLLPPEVAKGQPALLRARAGVLRALAPLLPARRAERRECLTALALCLRMQYYVTGEMTALDEAIDILRPLLRGRHGRDPKDVDAMISLANALRVRAAHSLRQDDPQEQEHGRNLRQEAAEQARWAVALAPDSDNALSCLGNVLLDLARETYDVATARESAELNRVAARARVTSHPAYVPLQLNAAWSASFVAKATKSVAAADDAIAALREAVRHAGPGHPDHLVARSELGVALTHRAELTHDPEAAREGRKLLDALVAELPSDHFEGRRARAQLVKSYRVEYELTEDIATLDAAVRLAREYLDSAEIEGQRWAYLLNESGYALIDMYAVTGDKRLLDEALPICRAAAQNLPEGSPDQANALLSLGTALPSLSALGETSRFVGLA